SYGPLSLRCFDADNAVPFTSTLFDYNAFLNTTDTSKLYGLAGISSTLSQFQSNTGYQLHGNNVDPLFVDTTDFNLLATSPCIHTGTYLTTTVGDGSGVNITVGDAGFFHDGYGMIRGDLIQVGTNSPVRITSIDYNAN